LVIDVGGIGVQVAAIIGEQFRQMGAGFVFGIAVTDDRRDHAAIGLGASGT
jgi:hypothetical protein